MESQCYWQELKNGGVPALLTDRDIDLARRALHAGCSLWDLCPVPT